MLEISLFGTPQIIGPKGPIALTRRQPLALLTILAIANTAVSRDRLAFLLWDDASQTQARQRLRGILYRLRQTFEAIDETNILLVTRSAVTLKPDTCQVDVWHFEKQALQVQKAQGLAAIAPGEQARSLYAGPLLHDFVLSDTPEFEHWLMGERTRLDQLYQETLAALVTAYTMNSQSEQAIATARQLLTLDPLREETHRALMKLYAATGRRSTAFEQYQQCETILRDELGVPPLPETRALYKALLHDQHLPHPSVKTSVWRTHPSLSTAFVGRKKELATLRQTLTAGLSGQPAVACVTGPVGIGKTHLIRQAVEHLAAPVWVGGGHGIGQTIPYATVLGPIRDALTRLASDPQENPSLRQLNLPDLWLAEASRLLPDLRLYRPDLRPPPPLPLDQTQARLFESLTRLVVALAHAWGGAILVLDDLDQADTASLNWLNNLVHHLPGVPLGLVVAYRHVPNSQALGHWLEDLTRLDIRHQLTLAPFSQSTITQLLRQTDLPASFIPTLSQRLWQETGGTPFFVLETLRALLEHDAEVTDILNQPLPLPQTVQEIIQTRIRTLDTVTQQVLDGCAVNAPVFAIDLVRAVSGRGEMETAVAIDTLLAHRFLVESSEGYRFVHTHLAEAAYNRIGVTRRRLLHRRTAEALQTRFPIPYALVAHHLEQAGLPAQAATNWLDAGRQAWQVFAVADALDALNKGLDLTPDISLRFSLLAQREEILHHLGRRPEQADNLDQMEALLNQINAQTATALVNRYQAEIAKRRGRWLIALNQWAEAEIRLCQTLSHDPEDEAALLLLAKALTNQQRREEAQTIATTALNQAVHRADRQAQINALITLSEIARAGENPIAAQTYLHQAVEQAERTADPVVRAHLVHNLGQIAFWHSHFDDALQHGLEAVQLYQSQASREGAAEAHLLVAKSLARLGRASEALAAYTQAQESYRAIQHNQGLAAATINAAVLSLRLGELEKGVELSQEAHDLFATVGDERGICAAANNVGGALIWLERSQEAETWLRQVLAQATALDLPLQQAAAMANLGAALIDLNRIDEASDIIRRGLAIRRKLGHVETCVDMATLAIARLRAHDLVEADAISQQAIAELEATPGGVEHPQRVFFARAQVLHALNKPAQAVLAQAQTYLEQTLLAVDTPIDRERLRRAFPFNADLMAVLEHGRWPDPPRLI